MFGFGGNQLGNNNNKSGVFGNQQNSTGSNAFGQSNTAFGGGNSSFNTNTGNSLFGASANTANTSFGNTANTNAGKSNAGFGSSLQNNGTSLFGQQSATNNQNTMNQAGSGGLFGTNNASSTTGTGTGLFGNNSNTGSGGIFGNSAASGTNNAPANNNSSGGLFGKPATSNSGGLFGQNNANSGATTGGGLFGSNTSNSTGAGATGGGLFGQNNAAQSSNSTGGGLFGGSTPNNNNKGGLFGSGGTNNAANTSTPGPGASGGLFGNNANASNATKPSIFGSSSGSTNAGSTNSGGLFGSSNTATSNASGGSLFGSNANQNNNTGTSLFGKPATASTAPSGGLFGSTQTQPTSLFGSQNTNTATAAPQQPLIATIKQAAYELPDVTPSPKLYTSLTAKPSQPKVVAHNQDKAVVVAPPSTAVAPKEPVKAKTETRKFMNNYKHFLEVRPTNLSIKRARLVINPTKTAAALPKPEEIEPKVPAANLSIFNKMSNDVTTVTINKKALSQGYYIRPSMDDLLTFSKSQLKNVKGLIIGRSGFGQIEYPDAVDLSSVANLGDLLGTLVIFKEGIVSVYPDEDKKAPEGSELNKPAIVTIEHVQPRDADNNVITDNADPRVGKFVDVLKKRCTEKGAQFLTFTQGIWVFKVPHFSVWGISPQEMIMDDTPEKILVDDEQEDVEMGATGDSSAEADFASALEPEIKNQVLPDALTVVKRDISPDYVVMDDQPKSWAETMKHNAFLAASSKALTNETSTNAARSAIFAGSRPAKKPKSDLTRPSSRDVSMTKELQPLPISLEALQHRTTITKRNNKLGKLSTRMNFNDLESIHADSSAWSITAMLFERSGEVKASLSSWIKRNVDPMPLSLSALDAIWYLITVNSLDEAAARATALNDVQLATTIACLGSNKPQHRENATKQMSYFISSGQLDQLPPVIRKIYELATGNIKGSAKVNVLEGLSWKQRIGMHLWYGSYDESKPLGDVVKQAVQDAPEDNKELEILKLVGSSNNLAALLNLVDKASAFLLLQALETSSSVVKDRQKIADNLYDDFSNSLLEEGRVSWAMFVALHIDDDARALKCARRVLAKNPTYKFDEGYLPKELINESAALYAHNVGQYTKEAEFLLAANLKDRAHEVIVSHVAPRAVVEENLASIMYLLEAVSGAKGWASGGRIYEDFHKFQRSADAGLARGLSASLETMVTPTLEIKAAARIMAGTVARVAASVLSTAEVMKMPLGADVVTIEASRRSLIDLEPR